MEEWKFLLQKDGDRSWLPLDSPDAEILEGRYRLVARSSQVNTDIGIRICHLATEEEPPKRRIQKRSSRTNDNGLMVVIPFTYLRAGIWEISCFSTDPMSDLMGDTLHHTVCLSVATCVTETDPDDWATPSATEHSELPASADSPVETPVEAIEGDPPESPTPAVVEVAQSTGLSMERLLAMTDQLSHQVVDEVFREFHWESGSATGAIADQESGSLAQPLSEATVSTPEASVTMQVEDAPPALNAATLRLHLEHTAFTAGRGQVFTLTGQVVVDDLAQLETEIPAYWLQTDPQKEDTVSTDAVEVEPSPSSGKPVVARELHLCLRDPQSSTILIREQQAFPGGTPPLHFRFSVSLPHTLSTYLLLGEVVLYGAQPDHDEAIALQVIPFTVTVDPENLVEELKKVNAALDKAMLEDGSRGAELADLAVQFSMKLRQEKLKSPLDLSFLNLTTLASTPEEQPQVQTTSQPVQAGTAQATVRPFVPGDTAPAALKQILPPQLHPAPERAIGKKHLELPVFDRSAAVIPVPSSQHDSSLEDLFSSAVAAPIEEDDSVLQESGLQEASQNAALKTTALEQLPLEAVEPLETADLESPAIAPDTKAPEASMPQSCLSESSELPVRPGTYPELSRALPLSAQDEDAASPIRLEFQSLKLQERFLHRLNQLAENTALTASLKRSLTHSSTGSTVTLEKSRVANSSPAFLETGAMAKEIVVEDDLSWRAEVPRSPRRRLNLNSEVPQNQWLVLPEDTPVPTPVVEILTNQIIADSPIHLRVKLPDIAPRIAVKLWVSDRQTRTLLDGPRWLMDFSPNGFDQLETNLEITAPQGSLDIRVEAISVEMQTQRESQKIGLDRSVTPSGLFALWDDDLGF
jgi:hypothetical protein